MTQDHRPTYRMPAEWEPHAATWLAWPHNPEDWPSKFQPIPWVYAEIVRHLSRVEAVNILVNDLAAERRATTILKRAGAHLAPIRFHHWPTDRVWLRDSGPIFVKRIDDSHADRSSRHSDPFLGQNLGISSAAELSGLNQNPSKHELAITNWKFNAWAKYPNFHHDDKIPNRVAKLLNLPELRPEVPPPPSAPAGSKPQRIVLEGGSIDVNGAGILLTTEECLLSEIQQRNPNLGDEAATRAALEAAFHDYLGIHQTIWLNRGCAGDDTHGHVDDITRFIPPAEGQSNTILTCVEPNTADENHLPLAENLDRLHAARNLTAKKPAPFRIIELPMPAPVVFEGQRLPASYANFYVANSLVLVPTFNDPNDRHALNIVASCFPDRQVVGIHAVDLVWGLGTLHCLSQQQPA